MSMNTKWVVVGVDHDEEGPVCKAGKNGEIIVTPPALIGTCVYGPFDAMKAALAFIRKHNGMHDSMTVEVLESPVNTEG